MASPTSNVAGQRRDAYEAFWQELAKDQQQQQQSSSSSSWGTLVVLTVVIGLIGFLWYRQQQQQAASATSNMTNKERREQLAQARLRALQQQQSSNSSFNNNNNSNNNNSFDKRNSSSSSIYEKETENKQITTATTTTTTKEEASKQGESKIIQKNTLEEKRSKTAAEIKEEKDSSNPSETTAAVTTVALDKSVVETAVTATTTTTIQLDEKSSPTKDETSATKSNQQQQQQQQQQLQQEGQQNEDKKVITKRKKKRPPPIQMICEALSKVLPTKKNMSIDVEEHDNANTWGRQGWWKRSISSKQQSNVTNNAICCYHLPMYKYWRNNPNNNNNDEEQEQEQEENWEYLCKSMYQCLLEEYNNTTANSSTTKKQQQEHYLEIPFLSLILSSTTTTKEKSTTTTVVLSLSEAISCYNKLQVLCDQGHSPFLIPSLIIPNDFEQFVWLCKQLQHEIVTSIASTINNQSMIPNDSLSRMHDHHNDDNDDDDNDDEDGLFSADYDQSIPTTPTTSSSINNKRQKNKPQTFWEEFMDLLCQTDSNGVGGGSGGAIISLSLLRALEFQYPDLSRRIVTTIFTALMEDVSHSRQQQRQQQQQQRQMTPSSSSLFPVISQHQQQQQSSSSALSTWLNPLSNYYTLFTPFLNEQIQQEVQGLLGSSSFSEDDIDNDDGIPKTGWEIENALFLTPLIVSAAPALHAADGLANSKIITEFQTTIPNFPFAVYTQDGNIEISRIFQSFRLQSRMAQRILVSLIKSSMKEDKEVWFDWMRLIISKNNALASLAKSDLLDNDPSSIVSQSCTRSFLIGFAASLLDLCSRSLLDRYNATKTNANTTTGADVNTAFDSLYLLDDAKWSVMFQGERYNPLSSSSSSSSSNNTKSSIVPPNKKYSGSTHFFFLTAALLRIALYPAIKMEHEYYDENHRLFDVIRAKANEKSTTSTTAGLPERFLLEASHKLCVWLGWRIQLEEPEFVTNVTNFTLLQLQWALDQCKALSSSSSSSMTKMIQEKIPDWIVKDPARWLAHVGRQMPHILKQNHAEHAIECSTELLEVGQKSFSPVVMTCLLRIASAFVYAGVHRARQRQRQSNRNRRWGGGKSENDDQEFDSRDPSIYLSFDKNDLGVTVFTNRLVCTRLCPTLIRTFVTLDVVEGLDMDREYDFDKFAVKNDIADLLLRLWSHPNGECRQSIVKDVKPAEFQSFASSLAAALSVNFDGAVEKMSTTIKTISHGRSRNGQQQHFIESHSNAAAGNFMGARRLLMLLCTMSAEESIAAVFGGGTGENSNDDMTSSSSSSSSHVRDLANVIVHFIDIITDQNGGTHPELELGLSESTYSMLQREATMSIDEKNNLVNQIERSRQYSINEIGLDVSTTCHQLLSLAARWHFAAKKKQKNNSSEKVPLSSPLLEALANHDDVDLKRWSLIASRLVIPTTQESRSPQVEAFFKDGYQHHHVTTTTSPRPFESPDDKPMDPQQKRRRNTAKHDQMTHEGIEEMLGNPKNINGFLSDLKEYIENLHSGEEENAHQLGVGGSVDIQELQQIILSGDNGVGNINNSNNNLCEEDYGKALAEYVVSSSPFASSSNNNTPGTFVHYYDRTARSRMSAGSDKSLVKEARKCHKMLPTPHVNSSCFVCFAEERMDLCRAVITGPVDTPYAHGLFIFDVYFPPTYPSVPPLVTFMTTGGGQVRFNPNLYVDGKVCLSLLGLTFAQDESQRWNPQQSSLAQVLLSMQAQIFGVKEPYFNEGSGIPLQLRNTPAGREGSKKHNSMLRLATLRYAIVAQLRNAPLGFEVITQRHFSMCRRRLLVQARRWMLEEEGTSAYPRFEKVYAELLRMLVRLGGGVGVSHDDILLTKKSLPPLPEDLSVVREKDPNFPPIITDGDDDGDDVDKHNYPPSPGSSFAGLEEDSKPTALIPNNPETNDSTKETPPPATVVGDKREEGTGDAVSTEYNPWANPALVTSTSITPQSNNKDDDAADDSDEDIYS